MTLEEQWLDNDYNPFFLFNVSGKLVSLNSEAQYILSSVDTKTIFELATTYSNSSFGFKTTFLDLAFKQLKFFGLTVGYIDENEIGIKLYQLPSFKFSKPTVEGALVNIYTIIDLCISTNSIGTKAFFSKNVDPSIPEIRLNTDLSIRLFNKIYEACHNSDEIVTKLYCRVGEYIKYEEKKYSLLSFEVEADKINEKSIYEIEQLCSRNGFLLEEHQQKIVINIPMMCI
jgi:nitrogen-specific signal transduction histidine kinase